MPTRLRAKDVTPSGRIDGAVDAASLDRLLRFGGSKLLTDMIAIFLLDAPKRIAEAKRGAASGDTAAVGRALHALKSSAGQLGAIFMAERCNIGEALASQRQAAGLPTIVADVELLFASARCELERRRAIELAPTATARAG